MHYTASIGLSYLITIHASSFTYKILQIYTLEANQQNVTSRIVTLHIRQLCLFHVI